VATYTDYIGSVSGGQARDGDFATLNLWQSASATNVSNGDIYEAVLIDGSAHYWTDPGTAWDNTADLNYGLVVRGENSHEGYWTSADRGTSAGAVLTLGSNVSWGTFGDQNIAYAEITAKDDTYQPRQPGNLESLHVSALTLEIGVDGR